MKAGWRRDGEIREKGEALRLGEGEPELVSMFVAQVDGAEGAKVNHAATSTKAVTGGRGVVWRSLRPTAGGWRAQYHSTEQRLGKASRPGVSHKNRTREVAADGLNAGRRGEALSAQRRQERLHLANERVPGTRAGTQRHRRVLERRTSRSGIAAREQRSCLGEMCLADERAPRARERVEHGDCARIAREGKRRVRHPGRERGLGCQNDCGAKGRPSRAIEVFARAQSLGCAGIRGRRIPRRQREARVENPDVDDMVVRTEQLRIVGEESKAYDGASCAVEVASLQLRLRETEQGAPFPVTTVLLRRLRGKKREVLYRRIRIAVEVRDLRVVHERLGGKMRRRVASHDAHEHVVQQTLRLCRLPEIVERYSEIVLGDGAVHRLSAARRIHGGKRAMVHRVSLPMVALSVE